MGAAPPRPLPYLPITSVPLPPDLGVEAVDGRDDPDCGASSAPSTLLSALAGVDRDDAGADSLLERSSSRDATRLMLDGRRSAVIILILVFMLSASLTMLVRQSSHLADSADWGSRATEQTSTASPKSSASSQTSPPSASTVQPQPQKASPTPTASPSPSSSVPSTSPGTAASNASGLIDLNTATAEQLDTINGIGPVTARRILEHRARNGRFTSVDELLDVQGIGAKTLEKIRPYVTVGP
ncbi:competence protein ComEA [Bifidobacterium primatium]|uniref:Competence protein ComEA n=1 Tax=Bifidobacterium primatium TaxID=2045438 RepID=A0A2M9H8K5_9BIFI|nr:competence protein ComEA [Bifidobacterium primatium]